MAQITLCRAQPYYKPLVRNTDTAWLYPHTVLQVFTASKNDWKILTMEMNGSPMPESSRVATRWPTFLSEFENMVLCCVTGASVLHSVTNHLKCGARERHTNVVDSHHPHHMTTWSPLLGWGKVGKQNPSQCCPDKKTVGVSRPCLT